MLLHLILVIVNALLAGHLTGQLLSCRYANRSLRVMNILAIVIDLTAVALNVCALMR